MSRQGFFNCLSSGIRTRVTDIYGSREFTVVGCTLLDYGSTKLAWGASVNTCLAHGLHRPARTSFHHWRLTFHPNVAGYQTVLKPQTTLNILQHVLTFALRYQLPPPSWLSPFRFSSTTQAACWIRVLPFRPTDSQPRSPSMSHVLLFLAIKSHFVFVVLSYDTSVSVMLMKGP